MFISDLLAESINSRRGGETSGRGSPIFYKKPQSQDVASRRAVWLGEHAGASPPNGQKASFAKCRLKDRRRSVDGRLCAIFTDPWNELGNSTDGIRLEGFWRRGCLRGERSSWRMTRSPGVGRPRRSRGCSAVCVRTGLEERELDRFRRAVEPRLPADRPILEKFAQALAQPDERCERDRLAQQLVPDHVSRVADQLGWNPLGSAVLGNGQEP